METRLVSKILIISANGPKLIAANSTIIRWGVFRLTDPPGVKAIMNCRNQGLFHPHDQEFIYTDAMRPGHVSEVHEMGFDVVDLRKDRN